MQATQGAHHRNQKCKYRRLAQTHVKIGKIGAIGYTLNKLQTADTHRTHGDQSTTGNTGNICKDSQDRKCDNQTKYTRDDQHLIRIETHHTHGIDFLIKFHDPQGSGEGTARTASHHDRSQQYTHFTGNRDTDQVNYQHRSTKLAQLT